jgi:hypothetical protein
MGGPIHEIVHPAFWVVLAIVVVAVVYMLGQMAGLW